MNRFLLLTFFLLITETSLCQQAKIDSTMQDLKAAKDDTSKVNALNLLSRNFSVAGDFSKAMNDAKEALSLAEKINFKKGIATAYNNIGIISMEQANYPEALKNYLISLQLRQEIGDRIGTSRSYNNIGNIYLQLGNYSEGLKNYFSALRIGEEIKDNGIISNAYGSIATVYAQQGNYTEALKNNLIALKIREQIGARHGIMLSYLNIGDIYENQGNYGEALKNYMDAIKIAKGDGDKRSLSYSYGSIGNVYFKQGKYSEALKYHQMALEIEKQVKDNFDIAYSYIFLGKIYTKQGNLTVAEKFLSDALLLSKENKSNDEIKDAYAALSELDSAKGNYKSAYQYYKLYAQFKDSTVNEKSNRQISQLKIQYETEKKDKQIKTQAFRNDILQTRIYYGIAISLMVIGIIVLLFYLRNRRKKREYEHTLVELELIALKSQLNPHFISNSLIAIKTFIDSQPEKASQFLMKFAKLMRHILDQSELPSITLKEELDTAALYMQIEALRLEYGFDYEIKCDPSIDTENTIVPSLILQPSIENAIRHGLAPKKEKGFIHIFIEQEGNLLKFTIEDNGIGKKFMGQKINSKNEKSFGLSITRKRIDILSKQLNMKGYVDLKFLPETTITEIALPVI